MNEQLEQNLQNPLTIVLLVVAFFWLGYVTRRDNEKTNPKRRMNK